MKWSQLIWKHTSSSRFWSRHFFIHLHLLSCCWQIFCLWNSVKSHWTKRPLLVIVIPRVPASRFISQTLPKYRTWRIISVQSPLRRHKILWYLFLSIQTNYMHTLRFSHFYTKDESLFKPHGRWVDSTFQLVLVFWPPNSYFQKSINPSTPWGGFYPPAFLPLVLGFVVTSVETVGDIQATCDVSGLPLEGPDADSRIQGGRGEGEWKRPCLDGDMLTFFCWAIL